MKLVSWHAVNSTLRESCRMTTPMEDMYTVIWSKPCWREVAMNNILVCWVSYILMHHSAGSCSTPCPMGHLKILVLLQPWVLSNPPSSASNHYSLAMNAYVSLLIDKGLKGNKMGGSVVSPTALQPKYIPHSLHIVSDNEYQFVYHI